MNVDDKIYNRDRKAEFIDFYVGQGETDKTQKSRENTRRLQTLTAGTNFSSRCFFCPREPTSA